MKKGLVLLQLRKKLRGYKVDGKGKLVSTEFEVFGSPHRV